VRNVEKLIVLFLLLTAVAIPACSEKGPKPGDKAPEAAASAPAGAVKKPSGLSYVELVPGKGAQPSAGKQVTVHYTGWLTDGTKFDSSRDRNEPFTFVIGAGQVIPGWDEGVISMKVGGKRKLIVPSQLGYGAAGAGGVIPPNATLIFEVELLEVGK
jgi:peptidylprolyl isomerase